MAMKRWGIWFLTAVFVFNGAASLATIDLPDLPPAVGHRDAAVTAEAQVYLQAQVQAEAAGPSHRDCDQVMTTAPDRDPVHHDDKCCPTCAMPSMLALAVASAVTFSSKAKRFLHANDEMVGHLVFIDPDIPKVAV